MDIGIILIYYSIVAFSFALSSFITIVLPANAASRDISEDNTHLDNSPIVWTLTWLAGFFIAFPLMLFIVLTNTTGLTYSMALKLIVDEKLREEIIKDMQD